VSLSTLAGGNRGSPDPRRRRFGRISQVLDGLTRVQTDMNKGDFS